MTIDHLQERNELARQLSAATSRVEARRERTAQAAEERDDLVIALAAAGMTHRQIAEIARLPTGRVAAIIGGVHRPAAQGRRAPRAAGSAAQTTPPPHSQRPHPPRPGRPRPTAPPPRKERRPPNPHNGSERPAPAPQRTRDSERWGRIARRALALIGTVFVGLPVGLLAIFFARYATATLGGNAAVLSLGLVLLGIPAAYVAWRFPRRLRRIVQAARDEDESWLTVRTVRAKQGPLRTVMAEHGVLGVCADVVMLAVFAWRAGKPPCGGREARRFVSRLMTMLGGALVVAFVISLVAGGVAFGVAALAGSETVGNIAGWIVVAGFAGWGVVVVRQRRRMKSATP
ncbi:MAG: hypothetical protein F4064_12970 [Acidimicrobiales bacterium]|nr:hypothetical protein [Acidimicrobiales bacterium]